MAKIEEKGKVGRPKLADEELIKDSWCRIASCSAIALVMVVCMVGVITTRTPWQVLSFKYVDNLSGSVAEINYSKTEVSEQKITRIIPAKKATKRIIGADGSVTRVIPAGSEGVTRIIEFN